MATDINTQLQNISTDVTAIGNVVNRLLTIFSGGGVANPDIATAKAELQAFSSNANNISSGILSTAHGGTGRTDGKCTDVYLIDLSESANEKGLFNILSTPTISSLDDLSVGQYAFAGSSVENVTNVPFGFNNGGISLVFKNKRTRHYQLCYSYDSGICAFRTSENPNNGWSAWHYGNYPTSMFLYISKNGNDKNDGTRNNPLASIAKAIEIIKAITPNVVYLSVGPGNWGDVTFENIKNTEISITNYDNKFFEPASSLEYEKPIFNNLSFINSRGKASHIVVSNAISCNIHSYVLIQNSDFSTIHSSNFSFAQVSGACTLLSNPSWGTHFRVITNGSLGISGTITIKSPNAASQMCLVGDGGVLYIDTAVTFTGSFSGAKIHVDRLGYCNNITEPSVADALIPGTGSMSGLCFANVIADPYTPHHDNMYSSGIAGRRWSEVFSATSAINTSDERVKTNIASLPEVVLKAWGEVDFVQFQFKDAFEKKGVNARLHSGLIVQRIMEKFSKYGIDPFRYGAVCYDSWGAKDWDEQVEDTPERIEFIKVIDSPATEDMAEQYHMEERRISATYKTVHHHEEGGDRYSLRYEEALCIEAAYQRDRANKLEARLAILEAKVK